MLSVLKWQKVALQNRIIRDISSIYHHWFLSCRTVWRLFVFCMIFFIFWSENDHHRFTGHREATLAEPLVKHDFHEFQGRDTWNELNLKHAGFGCTIYFIQSKRLWEFDENLSGALRSEDYFLTLLISKFGKL